MTKTTTDEYDRALTLFNSGDFEQCREAALAGLGENPKDTGLLRLAGKASLELDLGDATEYLEQAAALEPDNAEVWRELGDAFLYEGRIEDATNAIQRAVELRPDDVGALVDLAHAAHASGRTDAAIASLQQALGQRPDDITVLRSLVDMYRSAGQPEKALDAAHEIVARSPDDVLAALDVAELNLALDRLEDAAESFRRLRIVDDEPDHEIFSYHALIETEIRRDRWRSALDLAVDATRVDRYGRTTDILAYVVTQVFGLGDRPAPSRRDVDDALAESRIEHRRLHSALVI